MSYTQALEAAGAKVLEYKQTGSYQGSWGAIVEYNGTKSLVTGSYGSCSVCDAFEAEFDYDEAPYEENGKYFIGYSGEISKEQYDEKLATYNKRLSDFAQSYLTTPYSKQDIETKIASLKNDDWFDEEEKELYEWALPFLS